MPVPKDPIMLMSFINTCLRDQYDSLEALCEDRELDPEEIREKLASVGFSYVPELNQFR